MGGGRRDGPRGGRGRLPQMLEAVGDVAAGAIAVGDAAEGDVDYCRKAGLGDDTGAEDSGRRMIHA
jgi:hypothetical protein